MSIFRVLKANDSSLFQARSFYHSPRSPSRPSTSQLDSGVGNSGRIYNKEERTETHDNRRRCMNTQSANKRNREGERGGDNASKKLTRRDITRVEKEIRTTLLLWIAAMIHTEPSLKQAAHRSVALDSISFWEKHQKWECITTSLTEWKNSAWTRATWPGWMPGTFPGTNVSRIRAFTRLGSHGFRPIAASVIVGWHASASDLSVVLRNNET